MTPRQWKRAHRPPRKTPAVPSRRVCPGCRTMSDDVRVMNLYGVDVRGCSECQGAARAGVAHMHLFCNEEPTEDKVRAWLRPRVLVRERRAICDHQSQVYEPETRSGVQGVT